MYTVFLLGTWYPWEWHWVWSHRKSGRETQLSNNTLAMTPESIETYTHFKLSSPVSLPVFCDIYNFILLNLLLRFYRWSQLWKLFLHFLVLATQFFGCKIITVPEVHYGAKGPLVKALRTVNIENLLINHVYISMFTYCSEYSGQLGHLKSTLHALIGIHKNSRLSTYKFGFGSVPDDGGGGGYHHSVLTSVSSILFLVTKRASPIHCWSPLRPSNVLLQSLGNKSDGNKSDDDSREGYKITSKRSHNCVPGSLPVLVWVQNFQQ